jgi:hypothetical protein
MALLPNVRLRWKDLAGIKKTLPYWPHEENKVFLNRALCLYGGIHKASYDNLTAILKAGVP